jgi:GNAT superfamily N-acetyltransferase
VTLARLAPVPEIGAPAWRAATPSDVERIHAVAAVAHPAFPERVEVLGEKLRLFPSGCFVLAEAGAVLGYALSHPWLSTDVPALDRLLGALPDAPDCLFIHDVALLPRARGHGAARAVLDRLERTARERRLRLLTLVAVADTATFWGRLGFEVACGSPTGKDVQAYGPAARFMRKSLCAD